MPTTIQKITKRIRLLPREFMITRDLPRKLDHHFYELTTMEKMIYLFFLKRKWSAERIFFFEGCRGLHGQMYIAERKALFEAIVARRPRHCFEIGTYTGGGSTFFISSAFGKIGSGTLITMESSEYLFNKARNYYRTELSKLNGHVRFVPGNDVRDFDAEIRKADSVDCVFFDGAEDGEQTLEQYRYFLPHFRKGSVIIFHDWNTEKTKAVKPLILGDPQWKIIRELCPPESVGMSIFARL